MLISKVLNNPVYAGLTLATQFTQPLICAWKYVTQVVSHAPGSNHIGSSSVVVQAEFQC